MGPHPEAPVDVQKYIGSCLITQQTRSKRKSCPRSPHHPKDGVLCGPYIPPCNRCCNTTVQNPGYISNYAWTGVPLISVARHNKNHHHLQGHPGKSNRPHPRNNVTPQDYSVPLSVESSDNIDEILPIARLAIHAQGAPLILSHKDSEKSCKDLDVYSNSIPFKGRNFYLGENTTNSSNRLYMLMSGGNDDVHAYSSRDERTRCFIEEDLSGVSDSRTVSSSPSQSDCISTTSEDSGTSENGLPRIIKPRKRRKKDRRASESDGGSSCGSSTMEEVSGTIVTLKPYQPLCYRYDNNGFKIYPSPPMSPKETSNFQMSDFVAGSEKGWRRGPYPYPPSSRCRCPYCVPPPSTFLTPPDSPVDVSEDGLAMAMIRRGRACRSPDTNWMSRRETDVKMLTMGDVDDTSVDESVMRNQNTLVLTSATPPQRPWVYMTEPEHQAPCTFTVMCYNILCDKYATRQMYGYCPNWALDWTYRKKHILEELIHYKADIISLQEVETEQFYTFFLPKLQAEGYDGIFSPKSRAKTMSEHERKHVDGCAIFYKNDKFTLVKEHLMEFNQLAMANAEGSDDMLNRVMTKDNIGLAALLQTKAGAYSPGTDVSRMNQALLVCTAHIHWDPEYSDVKLIQTMMLVHEMKTFVDDILQKSNVPASQKLDPNVIPLILCGDFNSLPDSGVIEYLSSGRVSTRHCDFKEIVYKDCLSKLGNSAKSTEFTHPFQISRAYNDGIMPYTNYSYDFKGVIDYVFYSKLHMAVTGVLGPIDPQWLDENRIHGCPHPHVPSDHFPILVELKLHSTMPIHLSTLNGVILHR